MTRYGRNRNFFMSNQSKCAYPPKKIISRCNPEAKSFCNPIKVMGILLASLMGFLFYFSIVKEWPSYKPWKKGVDLDDILKQNMMEGMDEKSCISRYESVLYRKEQKHQPSSDLISRLRKYEALHKQCGPQTNSYKKALKYIKSGGQYTSNSTDCKYIIWTPIHGLGNRILSLTSAFLYALLTNRVLLVNPKSKISDIFCEPFPEVSWLLPSNFPIKNGKLNGFDQKSPESYGKLLKNNMHRRSSPPYLYLHLVHDYDDYDRKFFSDEAQTVFQKVPWLIVKSDIYFIQYLFSVPSFQQEISKLFPDLGTVFHHLGRYLFHPTNFVWGLITRYYNTNLARADERIGIQVRVFGENPDSGLFKRVLDQIMGCIMKENILPQINETESGVIRPGKLKTKAVLVTSLGSEYSEAIKRMYWERSTVTGELIEVYQPSHEKHQKFGNRMHNIKAWAEMYLLSLSDKLVISGWSTFGYIAHSLGGLKPWILYLPGNHLNLPVNHQISDPPCRRAVSLEPCMHFPPYYECWNTKLNSH